MLPTCMNWERAMLAFLVSRGESLYLVNIWLIVILMNVSSLWINCESLVTINLSGRDICTKQKYEWNCVITHPQTNDIMRVFNFMVQRIVHDQRIDFKRWIFSFEEPHKKEYHAYSNFITPWRRKVLSGRSFTYKFQCWHTLKLKQLAKLNSWKNLLL